MTRRPVDIQFIQDATVTRRKFLKHSSLALSAAAITGTARAKAAIKHSAQSPSPLISKGTQNEADPLWGMAMSYGEDRLDLIDLDNSQIMHSFEDFDATHAVVPIEHLNRFVIHGYRNSRKTGAIMVLGVDPVTKEWEVLLDKDIQGGRPLHWQPRPDLSEITFNTTGDGSLHVLDTKTLEITRYVGGGSHSNMAMMDDLLIATDEMAGPSQLLITDRKTNKVLTRTPVGHWGHGVTVNFERGEAYVWAKDGVHRVSLARKNMGQHLGRIPLLAAGERSWFCWTPQGGQFSHDVAWNWKDNIGDVYRPYLTAVDMKNARIERIATGDKDVRPSYLQVSPDGQLGLAALRGRDDIGVFDLKTNTYKGTVDIGAAEPTFFERDMAFCKDRNFALVTNTADKSVSLIDISKREEVRRIYLPRKPIWFKSLSA